jgi:hypothetical protein
MDINTPKGRKTLEQEREAIEIFERHNPTLRFIETPKARPALIDGVFIRAGVIEYTVEVKCRVSMSVDTFKHEYASEWLVTFDKVIQAIDLSSKLCVPIMGILYFPAEKTVFVKVIWSPNAGLMSAMDVRQSKTQRTVNGGEANRLNAYINMSDARVLT